MTEDNYNNYEEMDGENYDYSDDYEDRDDYGRDDWDDEPDRGCYEKYGGYNGYDDFTIDSAFDGDPDATWNVD